jgi:hypothetical protein
MQTKNWIEYYNQHYVPNLDLNSSGEKRGLSRNIYNRASGYRLIFEQLLEFKQTDFNIIETGSTRKPNNWKDGNSGGIFADFVSRTGGFVRSVDIDAEAVTAANEHIDSQYHLATCSDSVAWLNNLTDLDQVDLFYLDSRDVKWVDDRGSAEHHLKEFLAIEPHLNRDCVVAIDDNSFLANGQRTGKGRVIYQYLESKGILPIYDNYQIIYRFTND